MQRNEGWDTAFRDLIGEVVTAHRSVLRALGEAEPAPSFATDLAPEDTDAAEAASARARTVAEASELSATELTEARNPESARANALERTLWSSATLARAAAAVSGLPRVLTEKARALSTAIGGISGKLRHLARGLERGKDILEPSWHLWKRIEERLEDVIETGLNELPDVLRETADRIDKNEDDDPELAHEIRKAAEAEARANILAGKATPAEAAKRVRSLDISGQFTSKQEIPDPTLLAAFPNLRELLADYTTIKPLTPLANLTKLQRLDLTGTAVSDIEPLAGLAQLHTLYLGETAVSDIEPLAGLAQLHTLYLNGTAVSDIEPLAGLAQLQALDLNRTAVSDIEPLAGLAQLHTLSLIGTAVSDWSPVDHVDSVMGRPKDWRRRKL